MSEKLFDETCAARDALYSTLGSVDPDVIAHLMNPAFTGGPAWPSLRQAFSVIRRDSSTIVVSNGLSDPFDGVEEKNTGFEIEILAETKEEIEGGVSDSPLFKLVYATAQQAAHSGQFAGFLRQYGVVTMELYAEDCGLEPFQNDDGMVGIMIGIEHPDLPKMVEFPGGEVILATVQILTPQELLYVANAGAEGRNNLHQNLKTSGDYHFLSAGRKSQIGS